MKCKIITFKQVYDMIKKLSSEIEYSEFRPTTIVGLARGGWIPARLLCDFLAITDLISLKTEHWLQTGRTKDEATIRYPLTADMSQKRILVVDDITDTGMSLITATDYLKNNNHPEEMKTAVMQYIPGSKFRPDYYANKVKVWTWFIYPWNWIEDTSTLIVRLMKTQKKKGWRLVDISKGLKETFEIEWADRGLQYTLDTMAKRGQVKISKADQNITYILLDEKVIQL